MNWENNVAKKRIFPKVLTTIFSLAMIVLTFVVAVSADEVTQNDFTIRTADKDGNAWQSGVYSWGEPVYVNVVNNKASARQASIAAIFGQSLVNMRRISVWDSVATNVETITETCETRNATTNSTTFFDVCWHNSTFINQNIDQWVNIDFSAGTNKLRFTGGRTNHSPFSARRFKIDFDQPKNTAVKFNISVNESGTFAVLDPTLNSTFLYHQNVTYNTSNGTTGFPTATVPSIVLPFRLNGTVSLFTQNQINSSCFDVIVDNGTNALTCQANERSCRNGWNADFWKWCKVDALSGQNNNTINWGSNLTTNQSTTGSGLWGTDAMVIFIFDENSTINVANGIIDSSGDGRHGQLRNYSTDAAVPVEPCLFGSCPNLTSAGTRSALCIPDDPELDFNDADDNFTVEAWVTHNAGCAANGQPLFKKYFANGWGLLLRGANCDLNIFYDAGTEFSVITNMVTLGINNGSWHHIMVNVTQSSGTILTTGYFDGKRIQSTSNAGTITATTRPLVIGNFGEDVDCPTSTGPVQVFKGAIGFIGIWDGAKNDDYAMTRYRQYLTHTYPAPPPSAANAPPTVASVALNASSAVRYNSLNCSATPTDATNTSLLVNFTWYKGGVLQFIAQSSCLNNTQCNSSKLMPSVNKSEVYVCGANSFDGTDWSNETNSSSLTISNTAPVISASNFSNLTGTYINTTIVANATYTDLDSDTGTVFFNWSVNGVIKRLANYSVVGNGTVVNDTFYPGNHTRGDIILVNISSHDGTNGSNTEILTRTVSNYGPANTSTVLNASSAVTGDNLNCSVTPSDPENSTLLINFSWYKNGVQDSTLNNQVSCTNSTQCNASKIAPSVNESDNWFCRTQVFDGGAWSNITNSSALTVSNSAPAMQTLTPTTGTFYTQVPVSVACNATDIDLSDDITYDISGFFRTLAQGSQSWQSIVTGDADGLFTWDIANLAGQGSVDLNCSASDGTVSNLSFNPAGTLTIDRAPNITLVNISPDVSAFTNQTLNCSATVVDDLQASMTANFTWYNALVLNASALVTCGNNTLCNGTGIPSINTSRAQNWTCAVTVTDGVSNASSVNDTVLIVNSPPNVESVTLFPTPPQPSTKLNCSARLVDADGDTANITFAFYKNGVLQNQNGTTTGVLNGTTANSSNTVPASGVQGGDSWFCSAQAFDTGGNESTRLNASNATTNNAPQIINITTMPANLSQAIGSTAYWVVNVTDSDNDLSWCNLTLYWPNQSIITNFERVNMTKSPSGNLWNSSNVSISVGGYYNASINCSDGAQNQTNTSLISAVQTVINQTGTNYSATFFDSSQFKVNYSTDDIIQSAYVNITWPNATVVQYNMSTVDTIPNKTYRFNTTNITLTQFGTYSLKFFGLAGSGENNITTDSFGTGAAIQSSPDSVLATPDPREKVLLITLSVWQGTVANLSYNFSSALVDSSGSSVIGSSFSINFSRTNVSLTGPKTLNNSDAVLVQINGSSAVPDGLYTGNITILRLNDSQTNVIPITLGINPPAGKVTAVTNTDGSTSCSGTTCDWRPIYNAPTVRQSNSFFIKNTGNFTLTNCQTQLSDDLANATWISIEETQGFSISINQTVTRNVLIDSPPSGSWFGYFDTKCKATALGYNDSISSNTSNQPRIFVSALFTVGTQGASGAGGGAARTMEEVVVQPVNESQIVAQVLEEIGELCGDGVCGSSENPLGCSGDCKVNVDSLLCITGPDCSWRQNWFAKGVVFGTLGLATIVAIFSKGAFVA